MIVAVIAEQSLARMWHAVQSTEASIDLFELRLDFLETWSVAELAQLLACLPKPAILTLRPTAEGGYYSGEESTRLALLKALAAIQPAYLDIEWSVGEAFIVDLKHRFPAIKIIRSYHNYTETPADLEKILVKLRHPTTDIAKLVTFDHSILDVLRLLHFLKRHARSRPLTAFCLGDAGLVSRILGAILGNSLHYVSVVQPADPRIAAPHWQTLQENYRFLKLTPTTQVYALLGNPVDHSIGHRFHNQQFAQHNVNAVYVKITLDTAAAPRFFELLAGLPFAGFSVTTPLKKALLSCIEVMDYHCMKATAVNTIKWSRRGWLATNTDGLGAVAALNKVCSLAGARILMLGAGGAASAIALAIAEERPKDLVVVNRTLAKAASLADTVAAAAMDYATFTKLSHLSFDVVVNALPNTPETMALTVRQLTPHLRAGMVYLEIDYATPNRLLESKLAAAKCLTISARSFFLEQAYLQQAFWSAESDD